MLKAQGIIKSYEELSILKGIDLEVSKGELVTIVGPSGAGKSTLLHILGTLDEPEEGKVLINNQDVFHLPPTKLSQFRNKEIGFVFQFHNLLPEFTAYENICLPAMFGEQRPEEYQTRALELMALLGIDHRKNHKPNQLSGGEQQRIAVARAMINQPSIIFADEPSGNLDSKNADSLHNLFIKLKEELKQTFIIVTHNTEFSKMSDRVLTMRDGLIISGNMPKN